MSSENTALHFTGVARILRKQNMGCVFFLLQHGSSVISTRTHNEKNVTNEVYGQIK
jgi:hypothetical protein